VSGIEACAEARHQIESLRLAPAPGENEDCVGHSPAADGIMG